MDQIISAFGIDAKLIIIQLINFGILMVALGYFLYKPILRLLDERAEKIAQGLKDAESAAAAKAEAADEKKAVLAAAQAEAAEVAKRAKAAAESQANTIVSEASGKAGQVIKDAELKSEQIKAQALKESEKEIANLAVLAAEKVLRERA
jgi:F-type H+-transporting ATPase subunit b